MSDFRYFAERLTTASGGELDRIGQSMGHPRRMSGGVGLTDGAYRLELADRWYQLNPHPAGYGGPFLPPPPPGYTFDAEYRHVGKPHFSWTYEPRVQPDEPTFPTVEKSKCTRCGGPAYVGLLTVDCPKCGGAK